MAGLADALRGENGVDAGAAAEVEQRLTGVDLGMAEVVPNPSAPSIALCRTCASSSGEYSFCATISEEPSRVA